MKAVRLVDAFLVRFTGSRMLMLKYLTVGQLELHV